MSNRGDWGPPPGGGPPGEDPEARDSSEDLTVPRTMAMDAEAMRAAGISMPGDASAPSGGTAPPAAAPPEKKSKKGWLIGGCGGCLFILLSICCCSGYLTYLEEGVSYSDPGDELESFPIAHGSSFEFEVPWDGTGYAHLRAYVDVGEDAPASTTVIGVFDCTAYGEVEPREVEETRARFSDAPAGWIRMRGSDYVRDGETLRCRGRLTTTEGVPMRIVITEKQRPSDWLSEWF